MVKIIIMTTNSGAPVINTTSGRVRGAVLSLAGVGSNGEQQLFFEQFLGVRYAEPPVGELKFRAPQPIISSSRTDDMIADGTRRPTSCPQPIGLSDRYTSKYKNAPYVLEVESALVSEDCLHCNIYRPHQREQHRAQLPILFYIHGGSFITGSNTLEFFNGSRLAVETSTIVTVCNYRLGLHGFLRLEKNVDGVDGNQGLLDQALAIQFIHTNAQALGGNNSLITIFGESAGASSVHYHLLSNMSRAFFTNAAMLSGTATAFFAYTPPQRLTWHDCLSNMTDSNDDESVMLKKLQEMSWQQIYQEKFLQLQQLPIPLCTPVPTTDGKFISNAPANLLAAGDFKRAPVIAGTTSSEMLTLFPFLLGSEIFSQEPDVKIDNVTLIALLDRLLMGSGNASTGISVKNEYNATGKFPDDGHGRWQLLVAVGNDIFFKTPLKNLLDAYARVRVPVFQYEFRQVPTRPSYGVAVGTAAGHFDDVPFWFGLPLDKKYNFTEEEKQVSRQMMQALGNFAHSGSNPNSIGNRSEWQPTFLNSEEFIFQRT